MKQFIRFTALAVVFLLLGLSTAGAQEVMFSPGPDVTPSFAAGNGGFAWLDVDGDGLQDLLAPPGNLLINHKTYFTQVASTRTAIIQSGVNSCGLLMADFNGDGRPDIFSTNNSTPATGLWYDSAGVKYIVPTGTGDLASAGGTGEVFQGAAAAPIDHSNYLSLVWPGSFTNITGSAPYSVGGIWLLKGGASGFTNIGNKALAANLGIDTTRSFETWDPHFFDANNDGYQDLLMVSFRNGFSRIDTGSSPARKGCVMFMNDGTGKFKVPTGSYYAIDSVKMNKAGNADSLTWASLKADTGIVVDDTVRHLEAIGSTWGDLNNDGIPDIILTGLSSDNRTYGGGIQQIVVLYGKGDGTFTDKWNGTNYVVSGLPTSGSIRGWDIGDYNNDGIPDVYATRTYGSTSLYRGNGNGTYTEVTSQDYVQTASSGSHRSGGFVDYNNDGFLDLYNFANSYLQTSSGNSNNWIGFVPVGAGNNLNAVGARFALYTQGGTFKQFRYIKAEAGDGGGQQMRALFGIGINTSIDSVVVWWPDGNKQTFTGLAVDKYWTIKEGSVPPGTVALSYPANAATSANLVDTLKWSAGSNAVSYNVQVSLENTFTNSKLMVINKTGVTGTSQAFSLDSATTYYWRVQAVNGGFVSGYVGPNSFTTAGSTAPAVPTLVALHQATNQPAAMTLKVNKDVGASRYQWQVSTLPSFTTFVYNDSTADTTAAVSLAGGVKYYWQARAMNGAGVSAYSAIDTFTVMSPPSRPSLSKPANNALNVVSDSVIFVWTKISTATTYDLKVSTVNSTTTYTGITDTSYMVRNLAKLTNYTWAVEANNAGGTSYFTNNFTFTTVITAPAAPVLSTPAANAVDISRTTKFGWSPVPTATKYNIQIATDNAFASIVKDTTVSFDTTFTYNGQLASTTAFFWRARAWNDGGFSGWSSAQLFTTGTTSVGKETNNVPKAFALMQNYPNPFNPSTTILYDIPKSAHVTLRIYDVLGRLVTTLVDGIQAASSYKVEWNASAIASGVYFYRIEARSQDGSQNFTSVKKLLLMK